MYLRTPKRYQKQRRHVISLRWLWLWILTPVVALTGYYIYENRAEFAPPVQTFVSGIADSARMGVATITAPTPMPTENPVARLQIANAAWSNGSIDEALREYEQALPNDPNNVQAHYRYAFGLVMQGRAREALEAAEKTITANPYYSDSWAIRAQALTENGRYGEAIASAMQALSLNAQSARATAFLAEAYYRSNQIERALTTVQRALDMDPDCFEALYVYGLIQGESIFDFETAMESFQRAYTIAPNMPYIGIEIAWLQFREGDAEAAFATLEAILDSSPRNADALYAAAFLSFSAFGDGNTALDYLSRCVESDPSNIICHWYMGSVYFGLGNNESAARAFMRAVELGSTVPRHYLSAGRINTTLNNCRAAVPLLREGRALEAARTVPSTDMLTQFDDALAACGQNTPSAEPTVAPIEGDGTEATPEIDFSGESA
jgi:tetratricopeptide (TPR) repeat protein